MASASGLRDVSRRAVRAEIHSVAVRLFLENGYDATTIDQIAACVGMSQRTFFRYFGSKEELVLADHEHLGEALVHRLRERPEDEDVWTALRRAFDHIVEEQADPERRRRGAALQGIVDASPSLLAAHLEKFDAVQRDLTDLLGARRRAPDSWRARRAVVGAAFACLHAVVMTHGDGEPVRDLGEALDRTMGALREAVGDCRA